MRLFLLLAASAVLSGCAVADKVASVGRPPRFSKPTEVPAPLIERSIASSGIAAGAPAPEPQRPLPPASEPPAPSASLFRPGMAGLFSDQRARQRGDILTIRINVADRAAFDSRSERSRSGGESASLASLLGIDKLIDRVLPGKQSSGSGVSADSTSDWSGSGRTQRSETINLTLAAVVTEALPNGNLLIRGRQEMRVNNELRELVVTGLIRPQDIARDNSIRHSQIAEARVSYGGRGQITDAQQARWGQQIYDALFPF